MCEVGNDCDSNGKDFGMKKKEIKQFDFSEIPRIGYLHAYRNGDGGRVLELVSHRTKFDDGKETTILLWRDWNTREVLTSGTKSDRLMDCSREMEEWLSYRSDVYPTGRKNADGVRIVDVEGMSACEMMVQHLARGSFMGMKCESFTATRGENGTVFGKLRLKGKSNG